MNIDWLTFLLKLLLVPTFIGLVSLAGRRWGATVSGWLIGLPLSSGPVAFILALEQGVGFASQASRAIMLGIVSVFAYCVSYSWIAIRRGWLESTMAGATAFVVATFILNMLSLSLWVETVFALLTLLGSLYLLPRVGSDRSVPKLTRWELPLRMAAATALVFLITGLAALLGPQLTGLLTPFPIYVTTMGVFTHRSQGGEETVKLIRGVIIGTFTFIIFFLIVSSTLVALGLGFSFLAAIVASLLIHLTSLQFLRPKSQTLNPP